MPKSVLRNPETNFSANLYTFSTDQKPYLLPELRKRLKASDISPQGYPRVIDIGAGDGGAASLLVEENWRPTNILCVDRYKPLYFALRGANWMYIDLVVMAQQLRVEDAIRKGTARTDHPNRLETELHPLEGQFDLLLCFFVYLELRDKVRIALHFLRSGGIALFDWQTKTREELSNMKISRRT